MTDDEKVPTKWAENPDILMVLGRMAMNARLIEEWAPGSCASCRFRRTRQNGWRTVHSCENQDLKLIHDGDGQEIVLLNFGCRQHERHAGDQR